MLFFGNTYFFLRASVIQMPFVPTVYLPDSTPIRRSSFDVGTNLNSYCGSFFATSFITATSKPSDSPCSFT